MSSLFPTPIPRYYPRLSELITIDDLPEFLSFVENGLNGLLDKIHYKNLQFSKSYRGDSVFYSLEIVTKNIGIDLPFGLRFVLNPDMDGNSAISAFPVTVEYEWGILAFLHDFDLPKFAFDVKAFFELGLKIFKITEEQLLAHILNYFVQDDDLAGIKFESLIDTINDAYPQANLSLPPDGELTVVELATMIRTNVNIPESISGVLFGIYIANGNVNQAKQNLQAFFNIMVPDGIEAYIKDLITPHAKATLTVSAGIEFPPNILKPVNADGSPVSTDQRSLFRFGEATLYVDTQEGIGYDAEIAGSLIPEYNQIGNTGLIISFDRAKLDLSRTRNIPEADAASYSPDFVGLYVKYASVTLAHLGSEHPDHASATLYAEDLLIGSGGVSGRIGLEANGVLYRKFGEHFAAELNAFSLTFKHGSIVASSIAGTLTIPKFTSVNGEVKIGIQAHIFDNGDFSITALPQEAYYTITLPNVFNFHVRSLELGKEDGHFYIEVAGKLDFIVDLPVLGKVLPTDLDIYQLRIWDNGEIDFRGGAITLPISFRLRVGPVKLEVSQVVLGGYHKDLDIIDPDTQKPKQLRYKFFGFDGMVNTGRAGVTASGNGIKYYFSTNHDDVGVPFDQFMRIDGIGIDITIPGDVPEDKAAFFLSGFLSMNNPDPNVPDSPATNEYGGSVYFGMPKLGLEGTAGMRLQPDIPAFVVDIGLEFSVPILLGATGLGIYGFRGIIGQHFVPSRSATTPPLPETSSWWDYFKAKSKLTDREGIEIDKFASKSGFSVGAGVSIATVYDSGTTFSSKLFLLLGLPDVFLIQGQAGILRERIGLQDDVDPPFSALIVFSSQSVRGNLGVNYNLPEGPDYKGAILSVQGMLDMAFFFNNASGWYLNIGKDQPENERVRANVLSLFQGYAYLMLSLKGIKVGAGVQGELAINAGPVGIRIGGYVRMGGFVSFKPIQVGGYMQIGGYVDIRLGFIKIGASVNIYFAVEAPRPFNITGGIEVKIKILFAKVTIRADLSIRFNNDQSKLRQPIPVLALPDEVTGYLPASAVNIFTSETFPINYVQAENLSIIPAPDNVQWKYSFTQADSRGKVTIPLDSFIDIELLKPVKPNAFALGGATNQIAEGYMELLPPQRGASDQVKHEYELGGVDIFIWDATAQTWCNYNVYEAVTAIIEANTGINAVNLKDLQPGFWQFMEPNRFNKIRLMSQHMFSYAAGTKNQYLNLDDLNFDRKDVLCLESMVKQTIVNWSSTDLGHVYPQYSYFQEFGLMFRIWQLAGSVRFDAAVNGQVLQLDGNVGDFEIVFPEPVALVKLSFAGNRNDVLVRFVKTSYSVDEWGNGIPSEVNIFVSTVSRLQDHVVIDYDYQQHSRQGIDKVILEASTAEVLKFGGNLIVGGHLKLLADSPVDGLPDHMLDQEAGKTLFNAALYSKAFATEEVLAKNSGDTTGAYAVWELRSPQSVGNIFNGFLAGQPVIAPAYYTNNQADQALQVNYSYAFIGSDDALVIPASEALNIETGNFSVEATALIDPFESGVSTLVHKVNGVGNQITMKGFSLHLSRPLLDPELSYHTFEALPGYTIWFTAYDENGSHIIPASGSFAIDCSTGLIAAEQYVEVLVSVDRTLGEIRIYLNSILSATEELPEQLNLPVQPERWTSLSELSFNSLRKQSMADDYQIPPQKFLDEVQLMGDGINKTLQPVWRPNSIFAIRLQTQDRVNGSVTAPKSHIFGFRTVGPVGHFHQENPRFQELAAADRKDEFKLADLKHYIDYERSYPDAQSRYDQSKPVFLNDPQIRLFFKAAYLNVMYSNWHDYLGLAPVQSRLDLELLDPDANVLIPQLTWENLPPVEINENNYESLPSDLRVLYELSLAATGEGCTPAPLNFVRKVKKGHYDFPAPLKPQKIYTAVFKAVYKDGEMPAEASVPVHRFSFKTSRFSDFAEQVNSYIISNSPGQEHYAVTPLLTSLSETIIDNRLKPLIDGEESPSVEVRRYTSLMDRLLYGELNITQLEPAQRTTLYPIINDHGGQRRLLGILIRNPEPFNDPKLPKEQLNKTVAIQLTAAGGNNQPAASYKYLHATDTSSVFVTNATLSMPTGSLVIQFTQKLFDGTDFTDNSVQTQAIELSDFITL